MIGFFAMNGARPTARARPGPGGNFDVQGVEFPATLGAIAKAITGAYLSSSGNAFNALKHARKPKQRNQKGRAWQRGSEVVLVSLRRAQGRECRLRRLILDSGQVRSRPCQVRARLRVSSRGEVSGRW